MPNLMQSSLTPKSALLFAFPACFSLMLSACGGGGGGGSSNNTNNPTPTNAAPTASFSLDQSTGDAPLVITVDASASNDGDGQVVDYLWDFDVGTAIGEVAQYTFTQPGTYTITLTVTDDDNATGSLSRTLTVTDATRSASVSGRVSILSSTATDADVNDRLRATTSNNTFDLAQSLPTPVSLGGFANRPNRGESSGNLFASGDPADFYRVSLNGDELITLTVAEANADLDLRLWNSQRQIVDASLGGLGATETLELDQAGDYFIEVIPIIGASNYILTVGQNVAANFQQRQATRLTDPFIPGELILKSNKADPAPGLAKRALLPKFPEYTSRQRGPHLYLINDMAQRKKALKVPQAAFKDENLATKMATLLALKQLQQNPEHQYVELNLMAESHAVPNDTFYGAQWHYQAIALPQAWQNTTGSSSVIVAVVDSGVLLNHPDLIGRLEPGFDFISNDTRARDNEPGIDANPDDPGDLQYGGSSSFHGTHVAGTVGASTNNSAGVAGVTWQTRILPLRVLGQDGGTTFDIIQAVRYAAGLSNASGTLPTRRADIINLSLGSRFSSQSEQDTYTEITQAGVFVVASAGNDSSSVPSYPAAYDGVLGVSATTITNEIASYSNFGAAIDVAAPGGSNLTDLNGDGRGDGVLSTRGDDSGGNLQFVYTTLSGTSMAAPHVAGVIALMKAIYPTLTPAQFNSVLAAGDITDDLGATGRDDFYGFGLINAQKAVVAAQQFANGQGTDPGPILTASASTLNYGGFTERLDINLQNIGSGELQIEAVQASKPWVEVVAPNTPNGLGLYGLRINRTGLADGAYQASVTFASDANDVTVTIIMQVSQLNLSANAGLLYIILIDEDGNTAQQTVVDAVDGVYTYELNNLEAGQYRLFAGSDADDDSKLCDAGEACGAYPVLDSPDFIAVNGKLENFDFEAGFKVNLNTSALSTESSVTAPVTQLIINKSTDSQAP